MNPYITILLTVIGIYIILSASLNLAIGYTGLLNLGHVAFFGIGAYTSAILTKMGVPFIIALLLSGLIASIFGYLLVRATNRLKGDYLALATLGFSYVIYAVMINWRSLTNGALGISGIQYPSVFGIQITTDIGYLIFVAIICIITILILKRIINSPFGRLLEATRDDEVGLRVLGKSTFGIKYKVMMISAFFAGIAGSLFAHYIHYIDPSMFLLTEIILMLTIVIVGGLASLKGSIIAVFLILIIPELLRFMSLPSTILGPLRQMIYAAILIGILLYKPRGLFGRVDLA